MEGNERKMTGNERNMNGKKKKMEGNEWKWKEKQSLRTSIFQNFETGT